MNIIKTLRKPYLSIFLSTLVLFVSCSQYDSVDADKVNADTEPIFRKSLKYNTFEEYVSQHISLVEDLNELTDKENNIDMVYLSQSEAITVNYENLNNQIIQANISNHVGVTNVLLNIHDNLLGLYNFNKSNGNLSQKLFFETINAQINTYFDNYELNSKSLSCAEKRTRGRQRCMVGYSIAAVAIIASTWWTVGIGTGIAIAAATTSLVVCQSFVSSDYEKCIDE
jgi:hypothetical protein